MRAVKSQISLRIRDWNALEGAVRNTAAINAFKIFLTTTKRRERGLLNTLIIFKPPEKVKYIIPDYDFNAALLISTYYYIYIPQRVCFVRNGGLKIALWCVQA